MVLPLDSGTLCGLNKLGDTDCSWCHGRQSSFHGLNQSLVFENLIIRLIKSRTCERSYKRLILLRIFYQ